MNLKPEAVATCPIDEQTLDAFAYAINWRDLCTSRARGLLDDARAGGQVCDCEEDDYEDDPGHECADNLLDAAQCLAHAQVEASLAQAAATAALAAATVYGHIRPDAS